MGIQQQIKDIYYNNSVFCLKKNIHYYTNGFFFKWTLNVDKAYFAPIDFWNKKFGSLLSNYELLDKYQINKTPSRDKSC